MTILFFACGVCWPIGGVILLNGFVLVRATSSSAGGQTFSTDLIAYGSHLLRPPIVILVPSS